MNKTVADFPRLTMPTLQVLSKLLDALTEMSGADIIRRTGLASGTVYPTLMRLESAGWVKSKWERIDPSKAGRPRRRLYWMTPLGVAQARLAFAIIMPRGHK